MGRVKRTQTLPLSWQMASREVVSNRPWLKPSKNTTFMKTYTVTIAG